LAEIMDRYQPIERDLSIPIEEKTVEMVKAWNE